MTLAASRFAVFLWAIAILPSSSAAQLPGTRVPGGCDVPVAARTKEVGCYLTATQTLDQLPAGAVFWHLYEYPTRAAAEAAKPPSFGTVAESLGKVWLYVIAGKVLHDTRQPWMTVTTDWKPAKACIP